MLTTTPKQSDYVSLPPEYHRTRRKSNFSEGPAAKKNKVVLFAIKKKLQSVHNMNDKDERRHADREFKKHRIDNKNIKAESFGMGLKIGLRELGHSLKSGFVGVVEQPIQGHKEEGGVGILKGMLAGLTGLVTKPLTGIIFAASKTIEGVNSSVTFLDYRRWEREELITRPLYHRFRLVRPYRA